MVQSMAASDHWRRVSTPGWARASWKVTSICQRRTKMAMICAGSRSGRLQSMLVLAVHRAYASITGVSCGLTTFGSLPEH